MKCDSCGNDRATVHITETPMDKAAKKETHLCEECARKKGTLHEPTLPQMLSGLLSGYTEQEAGPAQDLACPKCGTTYAEFRSSGRLGCPEDYKAFKRALIPFLEKVHGETRHTGKSPAHPWQSPALDQRLGILQKEIEKCVQDEDFEKAAELRDRIQELKEKRDGLG